MLFRYRLVKLAMIIVRIILLARIRVQGLENIPDKPYIVVLNHTSTVDTPVLLMTFPVQKWRFFAVEKWKYHPIIGPIMGWLGAIYLARGAANSGRCSHFRIEGFNLTGTAVQKKKHNGSPFEQIRGRCCHGQLICQAKGSQRTNLQHRPAT